MLGKVHGDLMIEDCWLRVAIDARLTEPRCDHLINCRQGNASTQLR